MFFYVYCLDESVVKCNQFLSWKLLSCFHLSFHVSAENMAFVFFPHFVSLHCFSFLSFHCTRLHWTQHSLRQYDVITTCVPSFSWRAPAAWRSRINQSSVIFVLAVVITCDWLQTQRSSLEIAQTWIFLLTQSLDRSYLTTPLKTSKYPVEVLGFIEGTYKCGYRKS